MHRDPDADAAAWTAGLLGLAGDRPVVMFDSTLLDSTVVDSTVVDSTVVDPAALVVVTAPLDRVAPERRQPLAAAAAAGAAVLLCAPPGDPGGVRAHPPETLPEWLALLAGHGVYRVADPDLAWLPSWGVLAERAAVEVPDLVRRYEHQLLPAGGHRRAPELDERRLLALTDRIIGLEATLAEANYRRDMALLDRRDAILAEQAATAALAAADGAIEAMRASASWQLGQRAVGLLRRAAAPLPAPLRRRIRRRRSR